MKRNSLIEHKEVVVCEENGHVSMNYNVQLITPKANVRVKLVVLAMTTKSALIFTNYDKTGHSVETYHNRKREVLVVPTVTIKYMEFVVGLKTQPIKSGKIHVRYPCIIVLA